MKDSDAANARSGTSHRRSQTSRAEWAWLWREVRPFASYQIAVLLCILSATAMGLAAPLLLKWLIDDILPQRDWRALVLMTLLLAAALIGRGGLAGLGQFIGTLGVQRVNWRMRARLVQRTQSLPAAFHARHPVGDLVQRLEHDVGLVGEMGSDLLPSIVRMSLEIVMTVAIMIMLDWRVSAIVIPLLPLFAIVRHHYRMLLRRSAEATREATGQQCSLLVELLTGAVQVQLLGAEPRFARRYRRLALRTMRRQIEQRRNELAFTVTSLSLIALGTAAIVGYGGVRVLAGTLTAGGLVALYGYVANIFSPMSTAIELYARLNRVRASIGRLMDIDQAPDAIVDGPVAVRPAAAPAVLCCRNLSFRYGADTSILRRIDLEVRAGERVAVVGASGCGKSSLLQLMPRLHDVAGGQLLLDGRDIRSLPVAELRRAISFVPQNPVLFRGTLLDNLRYACPWVSPRDLADLAWMTCLDEVVERLARGWATELGPLGAGISGGEQQRLAIARALLLARPILILDEATSALDASTEARLLSRLDPWCVRRIVIVATHRVAAARWADRVVVMHAGEIVEAGTHDLLDRPGTRYRALWEHPETPTLVSPTPAANCGEGRLA